MSHRIPLIRATGLIVVGALFLAACGGGGVSRDEAIDVLTRDDILSASAAECVVDGIEASDKVSLGDLDKDDPGVEAAEATVEIMADCMLAEGAGAVGGDTTNDAPADTAAQAAETTQPMDATETTGIDNAGDDSEDSGADGDRILTDFDDLSPADPPPGDDADLDALWVECGEGSADACDRLFFESPGGSTYERFGFSCGAREIASCEDILG